MNKLDKKQRGMSLTGWIFVLAVGLFFILLTLSLAPSYVRYQSIASVMDTMVEEGKYKRATQTEIRKSFEKRIDINGVYDFDINTMRVVRSKSGGQEMTIEYQDKKPMVGNIEALLTFKKTVKL